MKRRAKMLSRTVCWTLGTILGFWVGHVTGDEPDPARFIMFWSGMVLAATLIHFDPPEVEEWSKSS